VAADLPDAVQLELAFRSAGGVSRGTARAAIEGMSAMSTCRVDGELVDAPRERRSMELRFGGQAVTGTAVSWGDVSTAYRSTGIGTIFVYTVVPRAVSALARTASTIRGIPVIGGIAQRALTASTRLLPNPSDTTLARTGSELWARATTADGRTVARRMSTPNSYALTADAVVAVARALAAGEIAPGVLTPSQALGPQFAQSLDGVTVDID
jgi:saccharopine dehydrogenase (NAD+, L-lysine-forming)